MVTFVELVLILIAYFFLGLLFASVRMFAYVYEETENSAEFNSAAEYYTSKYKSEQFLIDVTAFPLVMLGMIFEAFYFLLKSVIINIVKYMRGIE